MERRPVRSESSSSTGSAFSYALRSRRSSERDDGDFGPADQEKDHDVNAIEPSRTRSTSTSSSRTSLHVNDERKNTLTVAKASQSTATEHVSSTISRDLTEGLTVLEEENLRALSENRGRSMRKVMRRHASSSYSSQSTMPSPEIASPIIVRSETDASQRSDKSANMDESRGGEELDNTVNIPWRTDALSRQSRRNDPEAQGLNVGSNEEHFQVSNDDKKEVERPLKRENESPSQIKSGLRSALGDRGDVATVLARRGCDELGLNLLGDSILPRFLANLLDEINKQQYQIEFLDLEVEELNKKLLNPEVPDIEEDEKSSSLDSTDHRILHRISCKDKYHKHGSEVFLDRPTRRGFQLNGQEFLWDLTAYLYDNPDIIFIVYENYNCSATPSARTKQGRYRSTRSEDLDSRQIPPDSESIYIVSDNLRSILMEAGHCSPFESPFASRKRSRYDWRYRDETSENSQNDEMAAPYLFIYHHWEQLQRLAEQEKNPHLSSLLSYVDKFYKEEYGDADAQFAKGMISSTHLTKLWVPNKIFICKEKGHYIAYVLKEWPLRLEFDTAIVDYLNLRCWSWTYDGHELRRESVKKTVKLGSHEEIRIDQLTAYPLQYATKEVHDQLIERGRKFWRLRAKHPISYSGLDFQKDEYYHHRRFMIDAATYRSLHQPLWRKSPAADPFDRFDSWPGTIAREQEYLSDSELQILPPSVYGFDFQQKGWISLNIDSIEDITWNRDLFSRLVLPRKTKELIQALVNARISGDKDIISNKGNGLVILLHGGPGTGKTLTAETVAEISEKPLYRVTCGDIGTNAEEVEKYLSKIFTLGRIWGCVLLLDEADVFLEQRSLADLQRNSFVSVFLSILEYYDGILILTSNRVGTFDAAFRSRIQVPLHYANLTKSSRRKIWQNFLDMLEELEVEVDIAELERHLDDLAEDDMNGRQIRNCVTTARGLATFRKQRLGWKHFQQAIQTASEFQRYLNDVNDGLTEDEIARGDQLR